MSNTDSTVASQPLVDNAAVIVELLHGELRLVVLQQGAVLQTRWGVFHHDDLLNGGRPGQRWYARQLANEWAKRSRTEGDGVRKRRRVFARVLSAVHPALFPLVANQETQVVYGADAALIVAQLEIGPGDVVMEAGTGSGCLTLALARAVAPHGRVYTFDYHAQRVARARQRLEQVLAPVLQERFRQGDSAGTGALLGRLVTFVERDVGRDGLRFALSADRHHPSMAPADQVVADAVFLDLSEPHWVVASAGETLRPGTGTLMVFLPCVEQVHRVLAAIQECQAFYGSSVQTLIVREWETVRSAGDGRGCVSRPRPNGNHRGHTGYLVFARRRAEMPAEREDAKWVIEMPVVSM
ncbi:hypothetical protein CDCA_CDCA11G3307 [Cyanidium caldarium]|uniref:tRNA (adenine(58)-N(1))-methyltransferase n=1 Tax=Cyanidium caldarium TaxID=2771 RepID=A0AAV9IYB9_CYACA|nr:hypothetical protein CDCA_CDCA11G3307 [Cyanidium caldarium]